MPNTKLYPVTFSSPEIKSVTDYLEPPSIARSYVNDAETFLAIKGPDGITNRERIEATFTRPDEKIFIGASPGSLPIKVGTILYLEYERVNLEGVALDGIEVVSTNESAFKAAALAALEADQGYIAVDRPIRGQLQHGTAKETYPDLTVWVWVRALSAREDEEGELNGQFFDLSPFVQRITTNIGKNGGNFQIAIPPLVCILDDDNKWTLRKGTIDQFQAGSGNSLSGQGYVAYASLLHLETIQENVNKDPNNPIARNQFFFHNIISSNDLLFIRFETLKMEQSQRYRDKKNYYVNKNNLANRIYDMIGLVDSNTQTVNPAANDVSTIIAGRDLSKLFLEDSALFFPVAFSNGLVKLSGQADQKNSQIARNISGQYQMLGLYLSTTIEYILKFIIQGLANIKVVPDKLFTSYGTKINTKRTIRSGLNEIPNGQSVEIAKEIDEQPANGIWQIVKLVIDESVAERTLCDSSFSMANGGLMSYLHLAIQEPLCELYMDTYGDMYHLIVRQPPYTQKALISLLEGKVNTETGLVTQPPSVVDIEEADVIQENLQFDDSEVYSWYNFVPKNNFLGSTADFSMSYLGALFFEEYAQLYGSKQFNKVHPYLPYEPISNNHRNISLYFKQACLDLKYVVESSQYLPFSRRGTLILNGDRRLKIGNILRYKSTGEIFIIDGVQQDFNISENSIDRTTTVQVSRGLIEQLIYGVQYENTQGISRAVSYFNIIDTNLNFTEKTIISKIRTPKNPKPGNIKSQNTFVVTSIQKPEMIKGIAYLERYDAYPVNKNLFVRFINGITDKGFNVVLLPLSTNRTYIEQAALKAANSLNATPGTSKHEKGSAIDITIVNARSGQSFSKNTSEENWRSTGVPELARSLGLQWGGPSNDGKFGKYIDRVHFQIIGASQTNNVNEDPVEYETKDQKTTGLDLDNVFSNFKVNKFSFNFFQKRLQFDPNYRVVKNRQIFKTENGVQLLNEITVTAKKKK